MNRCWLALAFAVPVLAGCSLLVRPQEFVVYAPRLVQAPPPPRDIRAARTWQLVIAEPQAIAPYDGARIVVMPRAGEIEVYRGARWRDAAPMMLQDLLLRAHGDFVSVAMPGGGVRADFALRTTLRDFRAEYRTGERAPTVVLGVAAQLVVAATGSVVSTRDFSIEQPAAGTGMAEVFAAFEQAINRMLNDAVGWTLASGDAAWNVPAPR